MFDAQVTADTAYRKGVLGSIYVLIGCVSGFFLTLEHISWEWWASFAVGFLFTLTQIGGYVTVGHMSGKIGYQTTFTDNVRGTPTTHWSTPAELTRKGNRETFGSWIVVVVIVRIICFALTVLYKTNFLS